MRKIDNVIHFFQSFAKRKLPMWQFEFLFLLNFYDYFSTLSVSVIFGWFSFWVGEFSVCIDFAFLKMKNFNFGGRFL